MSKLTLPELMRTGSVTRWHIVRTARKQTIAEHMYLVWILVEYLCEKINYPEAYRRVVQRWALTHDIPEVVMGDIPSNAKRMMCQSGYGWIITKIEEIISKEHTDLKEESHKNPPGYPSPNEIVKMCDIAESYIFLTVEKVGVRSLTIANDHYDMMMEMGRILKDKIETSEYKQEIDEFIRTVLKCTSGDK